jgi:predicted P-loop ATPase
MLTLRGRQGLGKSALIAKLGGEWYSDSLNVSDMNDKTAAEKIQSFFIIEVGELAGLRKADIDKVKAFISRQDDKYRASFARRVTPHPRQCVFFGTTNSDRGYLRDVTGNRRYWNVQVTGKGLLSPWEITDAEIEQIWAEVKQKVKDGEPLYLPPKIEKIAIEEQLKAMEKDDRQGLVEEYLEILLPEDWYEMSVAERRHYIANEEFRPEGTEQRKRVSNIEIWVECFGKPKEDMKQMDSYAITSIMTQIRGWEKGGTPVSVRGYGKQRVYRRR